MKTLNSILLTAALVLVSSNVFAQSSGSDNATVSAEVLTTISVTNDVNVDFSTIAQDITSNNPTIDPDNAGSDANIIGTATAGRFYIAGVGGQTIIFPSSNFDPIIVNHTVDGDYQFEFAPALYGLAGDESTDARGSGGTDLSSGGTDVLDGSTPGEYTVWVGGTLSNPSDDDGSTTTATSLLAGDYSGTYTLTVDYE